MGACLSKVEPRQRKPATPDQIEKSGHGGDAKQTTIPTEFVKNKQRLLDTSNENTIPVTNINLPPTPLASTPGSGEGQTSEGSTDTPEGFRECINLLNDIKAANDIDALIHAIKKLLQRKMSNQQNSPDNASTSSQDPQNNPDNASTNSQDPQQMEEEERLRTSWTNRASKFLNYIKDSIKKKGLHQGIKTTAEILQQVARVNSIVGWLSMIAYLLSTIEKGIDNQTECLNLLRSMFNLAHHVKRLKDTIPEEKFKSAIELIAEGSITCYSQLESQIFSRTIKATVDSDALSSISRNIHELVADLILTVVTNIDLHTPRYVPPKQPLYPRWAVGIEKPVEDVLGLLRATESSSLAVVIYGFGGIGKSTVAKAVAAKMNLDNYNYSSVKIYQEQEKNDFRSLQQQILKDCFPTYNSGIIRHCEDGRDELLRAFKCENNKPIFLFIDNASRSYDLYELLPEVLEDLPRGSRILVTTRRLTATDMFEPFLVRKPYLLGPLDEQHAMKILFRNPAERGNIKNEYLERILRICSGVPLALKIVRDQLHKDEDAIRRCDRLLNDLENGGEVKAEKLSDCLFDFVYGELENHTQEAFLDICCFSLTNWNLQDVKYIVGAEAVTSLLETGLITSTAKQHDYSTMYFKGEEELIVHEIITAKGRRLGKHNRIVSFKSFWEAADDEKLGEIKGVWLIDDTSEHPLEEDQLNLMTKSLRVLALGEGIAVSGVSSKQFEKLSFLYIGGSITQLPVKLEELDKLTVFHGPFSVNGEVTLCKLPSSLLAVKVMEQSDDKVPENSEMEGALQCRQLEKLHFIGLRNLQKLPDGSNSLDALETLILDDFSTMEMLPEQVYQLPALTQLRLSNLLLLKELHFNFSQFRVLTHLDLKGCCTLKDLPSNIELLIALTHLSLSGCKNLESLPSNFGCLTALKYLNLSSCEKLQDLPLTFGNLKALKYLCLRRCIMLQALPSNFGQLSALEYLNLCYCEKLETLPFVLGEHGELGALKCVECSSELKEKVKSEIRENV